MAHQITRLSARSRLTRWACCVLLLCWIAVEPAHGQNHPPVLSSSSATKIASSFAPGVLTTILPEVKPEETISIHDLVEIRANPDLQRKPHATSESRTLYEMAHNAHFRTSSWCLEFTFKPLRMISVDLPMPSGKMQRKLIWYMVYRVRNTGNKLAPKQLPDGTFSAIAATPEPLRFIPQLVLRSHDLDRDGQPIGKSYLDRVIPSAIGPISRREISGAELLNSADIAEKLLPLEEGRAIEGTWGVATWEEIDPSIDFFSIDVGGLANGLWWEDSADKYQLGDPPGKGRKFLRKTLQLNFWRPGDDVAENEREIRYGVPPGEAERYGCGEGVAYQWIYR